MLETIDIEQHIVDLLKTVNVVDVIHKLNVTVKTYPGKKVTGRLNFGGAVQDFVLGGENTNAQQKEYILLLETMLPETIQDTFHGINVLCELPPEYITAKRNYVIITGWIKEQKEVCKLAATKKEPIPEPSLTNNKNRVIIQWNEQNNVLTDIFRQLKQIPNKEKEPAIGNSIPEVALFLKENFSCFSNTKLSTIEGMLKNNEANNNTPKISRRIIIEREKLE